MSAALAIFVKTPGLSPIKTRLAATIGAADAKRFHLLAAKAVAEVAKATQPDVVPHWAVAEAKGMESPLWRDFPRVWQGQGELGPRLHCVCSRLLASHDGVLLVGADAPQITAVLLRQALAALANPTTPFVLGCASDGGFWLFGTRKPIPAAAWHEPHYSCAATANELAAALAPLGLIATLPTLTDVDTGQDLVVLTTALAALADPVPAQQILREWLQDAIPNRRTAAAATPGSVARADFETYSVPASIQPDFVAPDRDSCRIPDPTTTR